MLVGEEDDRKILSNPASSLLAATIKPIDKQIYIKLSLCTFSAGFTQGTKRPGLHLLHRISAFAVKESAPGFSFLFCSLQT